MICMAESLMQYCSASCLFSEAFLTLSTYKMKSCYDIKTNKF